MTRPKRVPGEKPLFWIGSSREDLLAFPEIVKEEIGTALSVSQFGGKHPSAKPWRGEGPGVFEVAEDHRGDTYRQFIQSDSRRRFMSCKHSKRDRRAVFGRQRRT